MQTITFFNNKGGVGKTTLLYHVAYALSDLDVPTVVIDLDPQANLSSLFLKDDQLEKIWSGKAEKKGRPVLTPYSALEPLLEGTGAMQTIAPLLMDDRLWLIPGDLRLSNFELELARLWSDCFRGDPRAIRITTAFHKMIVDATESTGAKFALIDVGPNLGSINRAAMVATDFVVVPLSADLFSLRGLRNLGPMLDQWKSEWELCRERSKSSSMSSVMPEGSMIPLGYTVNVFNVRNGEPVQAFAHWINQSADAFAASLGRQDSRDELARIKNYNSLMPQAHMARKPIFRVNNTPAAIDCGADMSYLAERILERMRELKPGAA